MVLSNGLLVDFISVSPVPYYTDALFYQLKNITPYFQSISYQEYPSVFIVVERYNHNLSAYANYCPEEGFLLECLAQIFNIKQLDCYFTALIKGSRDEIDKRKEEEERRMQKAKTEQPEGGVKYVSMNMSEITKPLIEQMNEEDLAKYYRKHEREIEAEEQARNHAGKNRFLHGGWLYWFENELEQKRPALVIILGDEAKVTADVYSVNYYKTEARETILQEIQTKQSNDWIPFKTLYLDDKTLANKDLLQQKLLEAKPEIDAVLSEPRPWREIKIIPKTPERRINYADIEGDTGKVLYIERKSKTPKKTYVKPEPEPNDLGLYHIAGFQHYQGGEVAEQLKVGTELTLKAEPENEYDPNAVAIYFGDKKLGYIPKGKNEELSKLLRYGREGLFEVKINYKDLERHPERQFGIAVKIKTHATSKDPFSPLFTEIQ